MKILLSNHWLKKYGGSETFTYTMATALKRLGHSVEVFTHVPGEMSKRIKSHRIRTRYTPNMMPENYDLILANHKTTVNVLIGHGPLIQTCHGTTPRLEQPTKGADAYVAISDEVKAHIERRGFRCDAVIHNGVDLDRFKSTTALNEKPRFALSLAHSDEANMMIRQACNLHGIKLIELNKYKNPRFDTENIINKVDLVFSLGRGVYESLGCGRPVIVFDKRPYQEALGDGYITPENIDLFLSHNCSGRATRKKYTAITLADEIAKYNPEDGYINRKIAEEKFDVNLAILKYLEIL